MKAVIKDKWILCPVCGAKTRTQSRNEMFFACVFLLWRRGKCTHLCSAFDDRPLETEKFAEG